MSHMIQTCSRALPAVFGGGILGISIAGLGAAALGLTFPIVVEGLSALVGMLVVAFAS